MSKVPAEVERVAKALSPVGIDDKGRVHPSVMSIEDKLNELVLWTREVTDLIEMAQSSIKDNPMLGMFFK